MLSASTMFSFVQPSTTDGQQPKHNNFMNAERVYRVVFFFVTAGFSSKPQCLDVGEQHARVIKTVSLFKTFFQHFWKHELYCLDPFIIETPIAAQYGMSLLPTNQPTTTNNIKVSIAQRPSDCPQNNPCISQRINKLVTNVVKMPCYILDYTPYTLCFIQNIYVFSLTQTITPNSHACQALPLALGHCHTPMTLVQLQNNSMQYITIH